MIINLFYKTEDLPWLTQEQLNPSLDLLNDRIGVFKNQFNNKINICIGFILGENYNSEKVSNVISLYKQNDGLLSNKFVKDKFKDVLKLVIDKIFNSKSKKKTMLKMYLKFYLMRLSPQSEEEAIDKLEIIIKDKINFIFFTLHGLEKECLLLYNISSSPFCFAYINTSYFEKCRLPEKAMIFRKSISTLSLKNLEEIIEEIMFLSIKFYLIYILDFN